MKHFISSFTSGFVTNLSEAVEKKVGEQWVALHVEHKAILEETVGRVIQLVVQIPSVG